MKLEIKILPGEHTYQEAVQLVKGTGQYLIDERNELGGRMLVDAIGEGLLPNGEYWVQNGQEFDPEDLRYIEPKQPEGERKYVTYAAGYKYSSEVCRVVVYCSRPPWLSRFPHYSDKVTP